MRLTHLLLTSAALLLTGSLASASAPATTETPAAPAGEEAALMTPVDPAAQCPADDLDFLAADPDAMAAGPCGQCSSPNCRGGSIGQRCGFSGGRWYTCQFPFAEFCSEGGPKCYCWTGPLP